MKLYFEDDNGTKYEIQRGRIQNIVVVPPCFGCGGGLSGRPTAQIDLIHRSRVKGVWYMVDYDDVLDEVEREEKVDSVTEYLEKTKRIKKESARLKRLFKEIDENKKKLVFATIEDVAFMTITMQDLRERIIRGGTTCTYKNGANQFGEKQSPDAQLYLQMSQKQTQAMKILVDCLPKNTKDAGKEQDDFKDFVRGRD